MFVVVAYDITDNRRRTRLMKMLEGFGEHVQESVFECDLTAASYRKMMKQVLAIIDLRADNVRLYMLCSQDVERIQQMGVGRPVQKVRELVLA